MCRIYSIQVSVYHQFQRLAQLLEANDGGVDLLEIIHTPSIFRIQLV